MRLAPLVVLSLALVPGLASAEPVVRLAWRACPGLPASAITETFACNANGTPQGDPITFRLVASFESPVDLAQFVGLEAIVDVVTPAASLPYWWRLATGECREGSLNVSVAYGALGLCTNPFTGGGQVGSGATWTSEYATPDRGRLRVSVATDVPGPIVGGVPYTAFDVRLDASRTVDEIGPGCPGCCTPACVVLSTVTLYDMNGPAIELSAFGGENIVGWNGEAHFSTPTGCYVVGGCPTPAARSTWGAIKSVYR